MNRRCLLALGLALTASVAAAKTPARTLDSLNGKTVELPPDLPISDAEQKARENYQEYLKLQSADPKRAAEALRRLGDLELEAGESGDLARGADQLQASTYAAAVARYRERLSRYPQAADNDRVLYQLARAEESGGDPLGALATLDRLVQQHPRTALLDEVQFRRGEILFSRGRYPEAERAYQALLALDTKSAFREQARYKLGWSRFRQDRDGEAQDAFLDLLDGRFTGAGASPINPELNSLSPAVRELVNDSLRAMSLSFSRQQGVASLRQALRRRGDPGYGHLLYLSLAAQYLEQKRYQDGAGVLSGFVEAQPLHPRAPELYLQAIAALEAGEFGSQVLLARQAYVDRFGLDQPYWRAQGEPPSEPVLAYLRDSLWLLTQQHHALAQGKTIAAGDRAREYRSAAEGYRRYAGYFPKDARAAESQFLLGEVLFESGDFAAASQAYQAAAYDYPKHARSAESGYAALLAYQRQESGRAGAELAAWQRRRYEAVLRFAAAFPDHPQALAARLDAAEGLLAQRAGAEAIAAALPLTRDSRASAAQRRSAWLAIGHARVDAQDYPAAEAAYLQAQKLDQAAGRRDPQLAEHLAAAVYRQAETAQAAGQSGQAAADFLRVGQLAPEARLRASADLAAAQSYLAAGQTAAAVPVLEQLARQQGDRAVGAQALAKLALAYVDGGQPLAAAQTFERIANSAALTPAEQQEGLQRAARLYGEQQDGAGEARCLGLLLSRFPQDLAASLEARQRLIELALARNDAASVKSLSEQLIDADQRAGGARSARSRTLAAQASLRLALPLRDAFLAVRLNAPIKDSLKRKKALMESALAAYGRAADYGVAEVLTESTYRLGEIYFALSKSLLESERPARLDEQAREQYDLLLQEQAYPFEEKAIALHEANAQRARQGLYDPWVRSSFASLAQLVPGRYARPSKGEDYVDALR